MIVLDHSRIRGQKFVVRTPADQGVVVVGRLRVILDEADGHVPVLEDRLVQGLHWPEAVGWRGTPKPFDPGRRVGAPDLAGDEVVQA